MTNLVLICNVFQFSKEYFIQTRGTAFATKLTPCYANECDLLHQYPIKPSIWLHYIDDIFMIWNESEDNLKDFLTFILMVSPAIQFTVVYSFKSVNFLDVSVTLTDDETISTDIYTKPKDTHQYFHMNSCHPNHIKKAIVFSQVIRILRICGDPATAGLGVMN